MLFRILKKTSYILCVVSLALLVAFFAFSQRAFASETPGRGEGGGSGAGNFPSGIEEEEPSVSDVGESSSFIDSSTFLLSERTGILTVVGRSGEKTFILTTEDGKRYNLIVETFLSKWRLSMLSGRKLCVVGRVDLSTESIIVERYSLI